MKKILTTAAAILIGFPAISQTDLKTKNSNKMEQEQIIQTITSMFNGADEHDWKKVQHAFATGVLLDFSSLSGAPASTQTPKQIVESWSAFLPGFDKTHHQLSGFQVTQKGNLATVHYNGKADHFIGNECWTVEGTYDTEISNINNTWAITKHKLNLSAQSGNKTLPAKAAEIMKTKSAKVTKEKIHFNSEA